LILISPIKTQRKKLIMKRLYRSLTYEGSIVVLIAGYRYIGYRILLMILTVTALLYTPYLIKSLINLKKLNWIISFCIMIIVPVILMLFYFQNHLMKMIFFNIALLMFYLFCWILKFSVHSWIEKIEYTEFEY